MNCPGCGAPLPSQPTGDALPCAYCGSVYLPNANNDGVRIFDESPAEPCPVCGVPLMHASLAGAAIRYCTRCHGLLIPMDAFEPLLSAVAAQPGPPQIPAVADPSQLDRRLACPHCHQPMDTHFYAGPGNVILSDCERCQLNWLDHGKLQRLARAVAENVPGTVGDPFGDDTALLHTSDLSS
ncbi:MAG TPA: zf-TFIIB domain-containing protein [Acidobacteriaceae bacterium]|jgi:Zn-finger nucleic acid-binding protein|nr:zf-TFIIB domain-containing protein [Acidobacteriaceae bacterium]